VEAIVGVPSREGRFDVSINHKRGRMPSLSRPVRRMCDDEFFTDLCRLIVGLATRIIINGDADGNAAELINTTVRIEIKLKMISGELIAPFAKSAIRKKGDPRAFYVRARMFLSPEGGKNSRGNRARK